MEKGRDYMVGKYPDKYGIHLPNPQLQDPVEFGLNEERKVIDWIESNL